MATNEDSGTLSASLLKWVAIPLLAFVLASFVTK